jgi:hypothetical protein
VYEINDNNKMEKGQKFIGLLKKVVKNVVLPFRMLLILPPVQAFAKKIDGNCESKVVPSKKM